MNFQTWHKTGKYFDYKGHRIFYQEGGQGEPLLLIHGFPTASWDWNKLWKSLTARYHVIAPDMIGFGYSAKPKQYDYRLTDQANLHFALMEHLGIDNFHLFVHDYGVSVGQEMIAQQIDGKGISMPSVAFLNGGIFPATHRAKLIQKLLISPIGYWIAQLTSKTRVRKTFDNIFGVNKATEEELEEFWQLMTRDEGKKVTHLLIRYMTDRKNNMERWESALVNAPMPLRYINGPLDPVSGRHSGEMFEDRVPNADVVYVEGAGHYPHTEMPDEVLEAYLEFRDRLK